jgi:predicted ATPase/DNA-binding SARP family transcriptional activator/class 3 adenylate cyclase
MASVWRLGGPVQFCVLGRIAVIDNGREVALTSQREAALLAELLLHANHVVSTSRVIDDIWGDDPPVGVAATLHTHVKNLRRLLEPQRTPGTANSVLVTRRPGYVLLVGPEGLDAWCSQRLMTEGRAALAAGDAVVAKDRLEAALGLWRGPAYGPLGSERFLRAAATELDELRLSTTEDRVEADLILGGHAELCAELERLVVEHPYRERMWAQLMVAMYRSGRQTDALRAYQRLRHRLGEDLGIEPGTEVRELESAILAHAEVIDWKAPSPTTRPLFAPRSPSTSAAAPAHPTGTGPLSEEAVPVRCRPVVEETLIGRGDELQARPMGTVTFLVTDIERSTQPWERQPDAMRWPLARHDEIVREAVAAHEGTVLPTGGDGFAAAFGNPTDAVSAALAVMARLGEEPWPADAAIRARAAIDVEVADERGRDHFGPVVNRTARLMAAAHGGQVVVSAAAAGLLPGVELVDLGTHRLRDLTAPEHIFQLAACGRHPPLRTLSPRWHNLPVQRTELFGREQDLDRIVELSRAHRLVTLAGMGGIGKTRLALAAAARFVDEAPDGVWFIDLVPVAQGGRLPEVIADATGLVPSGTGDLVDGLCAVLADRRMVLVLDNCEHIVDAVANLVEAVLSRTVGPRVLVTSREPLGLVDEVHFRVEPLPTGEDDGGPALQLLSAAAARVGVSIGDADLGAAGELCRRLDGLPLSLELAGAQLRGLSVQAMVERLDSRFELLGRQRRGLNARHASLLAVLEGTWLELSADDRLLLAQLAAFPAAFDLGSVETVASALGVATPALVLTRLVDLGLVFTDGFHYRLLETIRLFVRQRTDHERHDRLHADWCLRRATAESWAGQFLSRDLLRWVCAHHDDLVAAEHHFVAAGDFTAVSALLGGQCNALNTALGGAKATGTILRIEQHLASEVPAVHDRAVLNLAAAFAGRPGRRPDWIVKGAQEAAALFAASGDDIGLAMALIVQSWMTALRDTEASLELVARAIEAAERAGEAPFARFARTNRAMPFIAALRFGEAAAELDRVRPLLALPPDDVTSDWFANFQCINDVFFDPARAGRIVPLLYEQQSVRFEAADSSLIPFATAAASAGDIDWTHRLVGESVERIRRGGSDDGLPDLLVPIAMLAWRLNDQERARRLLTAVKHAGRPTSNIGSTIAYRGLGQFIAIDPDKPADLDLSLEFRAARTWLHELANDDAPETTDDSGSLELTARAFGRR